MKNCFYVAKSLHDAITFIKANTNWKQVTNVSFRSGDENIIIITQFMRIRGRKVDKVYIDYSFYSLPNSEWYDFKQRFHHLGIEPIVIHEVGAKAWEHAVNDDSQSDLDKESFMKEHLNQWACSVDNKAFKLPIRKITKEEEKAHLIGLDYNDIKVYTEDGLSICMVYSNISRSAIVLSENKSKSKAISDARDKVFLANKNKANNEIT